MRDALDQLWVWMTMDGKRVIDLDPQEIQCLQFEVLQVLWMQHGLNNWEKHDPEAEILCDQLMYGEDGNGWIEQAKKLGVIRKRTKQERTNQNYQEQKYLEHCRAEANQL